MENPKRMMTAKTNVTQFMRTEAILPEPHWTQEWSLLFQGERLSMILTCSSVKSLSPSAALMVLR